MPVPTASPHPLTQGRVSASLLCMSLCLTLFSSLMGCGSAAPEPERAHDQGANADAAPTRIAALTPFAADQLLAMGITPVAAPQLRGNTPEAWAEIPTIALDHSAGPNLEQLIAADPDVIVTSSVYAQFLPMMSRSTGAEIELLDIDSIADVERGIERLAQLAMAPDAGAERIAALREGVGSAPEPGTAIEVLAIFGTPHAFYAFLPSSYLGDLVLSAGATLIPDDLQSHPVFRGLAPLSMESVIDHDPDLLLVIFHGSPESAQAMLDADPLWSQLKAVRSGSIAFLEDDLYAMRPGSELPRALGEIRRVIDEARSAP